MVTTTVVNEFHKIRGLPPSYSRKRVWRPNNTPAAAYQRNQIIDRTVRVPASMFTMNLGSLSAYAAKPWHPQSDRAAPSRQMYHTTASSRPGGQSPGGIGCDVKHGSYDRYLRRLKAGHLNRGPTIVTGCACDKTNVYYDPNPLLPPVDIPYTKSYRGGEVVYRLVDGVYYHAIITTNNGDDTYDIKYTETEATHTSIPASQLNSFIPCNLLC